MTEELKKIFPEELYILESGEKVTVSPISFRKLRVFGEAIASLAGKMQQSGFDGSFENPAVIGRLIAVAFDEIIGVMSLVLGKDDEWFDRISIADGIGLGTLIVRQNFNEDAKKNLTALLEKIPKG